MAGNMLWHPDLQSRTGMASESQWAETSKEKNSQGGGKLKKFRNIASKSATGKTEEREWEPSTWKAGTYWQAFRLPAPSPRFVLKSELPCQLVNILSLCWTHEIIKLHFWAS